MLDEIASFFTGSHSNSINPLHTTAQNQYVKHVPLLSNELNVNVTSAGRDGKTHGYHGRIRFRTGAMGNLLPCACDYLVTGQDRLGKGSDAHG